VIEAPQHAMRLVHTHASGAEEWSCPQCGRRFVMAWAPSFKRIVLEVGDETVAHSGAKDTPGFSLRLGPSVAPEGDSMPRDGTSLTDDMRDWLRDAGFEDWWGEDE